MSEHTPEPWHVTRMDRGAVLVESSDHYIIAELMQFATEDRRETNARRIVACVNACKDWPAEQLEQWTNDPTSPLLMHRLLANHEREQRLREERDGLLNILNRAGIGIGALDDTQEHYHLKCIYVEEIQPAILAETEVAP